MSLPKSILVSYAAMDVCNPVTRQTIEETLDRGAIAEGAQCIDVGCGNAAMAIHLAETRGFVVDALERDGPMARLAEARAAGRGAPGQVRVHEVDAGAYLSSAQPVDLLVCAGASFVVPGAKSTEAVLESLARSVRPGGFLMWADVFWLTPPTPEMRAMTPGQVINEGFSETLLAGEAAGLACWSAIESSRETWDAYSSDLVSANQRWLDENPDHPEVGAVRAHYMLQRGLYLNLYRKAFGFGTFLFRKPPA